VCGSKSSIKETVGYTIKFLKSGKIRRISLFKVATTTIRRAASIDHIIAVEVEFSLFNTELQNNEVTSTCAQLGVLIIAYSPLGRRFLTR
jgi:pyridoxine 4-dehydrogenase